MTPLSLDCLTLPDIGPAELIRIAAAAGYASVSLWVQPPAMSEFMLATPAMKDGIAGALADTGVVLGNLEVFNLNGDAPVDGYEAVLAFGASLGARSATAIDYGSPRPDTAERLAAFHALCHRYGLETYVEPISMGATRTLEDGVALIAAAGVDARLVVDCLHLIRTGSSAASLAAIPPARIAYVQICDGPAAVTADQLAEEATVERLYPGEGEFPLSALLQAAPGHALLGVEVPSLSRQQRGVSPLDRAQAAMAATRAVMTRQKDATR